MSTPYRYHEGYHYLRHNHSRYTEGNHTITTSVSIRVTPLHDHFVSWGILWAGFMLAAAVAAWQVVKENRIFALRRAAVDDGDQAGVAVGDGESVSTADTTRSMVRTVECKQSS
jgi:hypothetical protein